MRPHLGFSRQCDAVSQVTRPYVRAIQIAAVAALASIACSLATYDGLATSIVEPSRSLTVDEQQEYLVGAAEGVLSATILSVVDTVTSTRYQPGQVHKFRGVLVLPHRWLKGRGELAPLFIGVPSVAGPSRAFLDSLARRAPVPAILYMRQPRWLPRGPANGPQDLSVLPPVSTAFDWVLNTTLTVPGRGIVIANDLRALATKQEMVIDALARSSLEGLAQRADLVVVGTIMDDRAIHARNDGLGACARFKVDENMGGDAILDVIAVCWLTKWVADPHRQLLFLRRSGAQYEVLGPRGEGSAEIADGAVPAFSQTLGEIRTAVAVARGKRNGAHDNE